jgi:CBS domain-containing protein
MMSMLVKVLDDVEETRNEPKEKLSTKEKLMQIVRGNGKLVGMVTSDIIDRNYVPSRPKPAGRIVLMIGGSAREKREYRPVDPRRPQQSRVVQSEADTMQSENEKK